MDALQTLEPKEGFCKISVRLMANSPDPPPLSPIDPLPTF